MSITVKQLTDNFKYMKDDEVAKLVGKFNFCEKDLIPLGNLAACNNFDVKVFAAKNEQGNFIRLVKGDAQESVAQASGVQVPPLLQNNSQNCSVFALNNGTLPLNRKKASIFS